MNSIFKKQKYIKDILLKWQNVALHCSNYNVGSSSSVGGVTNVKENKRKTKEGKERKEE
jgi:hypothetical protein